MIYQKYDLPMPSPVEEMRAMGGHQLSGPGTMLFWKQALCRSVNANLRNTIVPTFSPSTDSSFLSNLPQVSKRNLRILPQMISNPWPPQHQYWMGDV